MAQYEIKAEYDDPKEIPFKSNCIYCFGKANSQIRIGEQSKIKRMFSSPVFLCIFFLVYCLILYPFMKNHSITAPALFLAGITWSFFRILAKRYFRNLFRYAEAYICPSCFEKWRRIQTVQNIYWGIIFASFLILVILSFVYGPDELQHSDLAVGAFTICIVGVLLQSWILGLIERVLKLRLKEPFTLTKQGFLHGVSRLTMPEEAFVKLVNEEVENDNTR